MTSPNTELGSTDKWPIRPAHGDIKLDNILITEKRIQIVDWELFGNAPAGWDIVSCAGSMIFACTRDTSSRELHPETSIDFGQAFKSANCLIELLVSKLEDAYPDLNAWNYANQLLVRYILERVASEAAMKLRLSPVDLVTVEVVKALSVHGLRKLAS